jgi:XTP/dITP diphosphohydrolase
VAAYADPAGSIKTARGEWDGVVAFTQHGTNGFGYDPIFYIPELNKSVAELSQAEKDARSHRLLAFTGLISSLN